MAINKPNSETENAGAMNNDKTMNDDKTTSGGAFPTKSAKDANPLTDKMPASPAGGRVIFPAGGAVNAPVDSMGKPIENKPAENKLAENKPAESVSVITNDAIGQAKDKASSVLGEQKTNLASGVASVADSIRQVGENLGKSNENNQITALAGKYGDSLAGQVEKFSSYLEDREFKELMRDVEQFARRNPAVFVGGAFALGILAARFLKSSGRSQASGKRSPNNRAGNHSAGANTQSSDN